MTEPLLSAIFGFNRQQVRLVPALRCTLGLAVTLMGFWHYGHLNYGVLAGLGSIYAGLASFRGVYQERLRHIVAVTLLMAVLTIFGTLISGNAYACVIGVSGVAFLSTLYAEASPTYGQLSTFAIGTLVILSKLLKSQGDPIPVALGNAGLIMVGGASQLVMITLFAPLAQHFPERSAVAATYDGLANFAGSLARGEEVQMMDGSSLQQARELMDGLARYRMKPEQVALRRALSAAEGVRASLVGLGFSATEMRPKIAPFLFFLQSRFKDIAEAARHGRLMDLPPAADAELPPGLNDHVNESLRVIESILEHLHDPLPGLMSPASVSTHLSHRLSPRLLALMQSKSLCSIAVRHAARYSVALFFAESLSRFGPFGNGYWIPLTTCMVLRPDYASTITVGVARACGTVLGVLVALGIALSFHPDLSGHVGLVIASTFVFSLFYLSNYTLFTASVTLWVIFSVSASGIAERLIGMQRLEATGIGILLAVITYILFPNWQSSRVDEVLRDTIKAQITFCDQVLLAPTMPEAEEWEKLLYGARALRYAAESVVRSAALEPNWSRVPRRAPSTLILSDLEMTAALMLALHARRLASAEVGPDFREQVESVKDRSAEFLLLI